MALTDPTTHRWQGVQRPYSSTDVERLRGSVTIEYSLARLGAVKFWQLLHSEPVVTALGSMTGDQAIQSVQAGLKAIYCSGGQVAGDGNSAGEVYPDQSLYPVDSIPKMVDRINNALLRTDQIHHMQCDHEIDWMVPVIADAEAGFGGNLNAFELTKALLRAGAAGVHFEDQLSSARTGGLGGKVLVSTQEAINKLVAARLAADVMGVPTVIIARTHAAAADLLLSDHDPRDRPFITGARSSEGYFQVRPGIDQAIARGLAYAPYCDMIWCETSRPDLAEAKRFAAAIHARFPGKLLAYNCAPSVNWAARLPAGAMRRWREDLAAAGYKFQFIALAGWHALNLSMFELAAAYSADGMFGYSQLQQRELGMQAAGYRAVAHQAFVGTSYFDAVQRAISTPHATDALTSSTGSGQFHAHSTRERVVA